MRSHLPLSVALLLALVAALPTATGDRSPYVPDPVTYPGLLPQFTSTTPGPPAEEHRPATAKPPSPKPPATSRPPPGDHQPRPPTTTRRPAGAPVDEDLGDRFGEEATPQHAPRPCDSSHERDRVPCYNCIVYISRSGRITRFYPARDDRED